LTRTQPTSEGADECSYSERLKRAFEAYEKGLAEEPSPLLDGFSDVVLSDSDLQRRLIRGASIEAAKPGFWDSVKKWRRAVGVASVKCKRFFANIGEKSQQQNSGIARHIEVSLATPGALKQQLVNREIRSHTLPKIGEQLEKIRGRLKSLRAEADESVNKVVYRRVSLGVVMFAAIIGLWSPVFLYLIARANSRSQELVGWRTQSPATA
jgi:hypothetical protein